MNQFLTSNEWPWRLARTIVQGVLGVVIANIDQLMGAAVLDPTWRAILVALVMAVLAPVMAELGGAPPEDPGEAPEAPGVGDDLDLD